MKEVDGFAIVITDNDGKIIEVSEFQWKNSQLYNCMGSTEIMDTLFELNSKNAEVLIPLTYHSSGGKWIGDVWSDPEQHLFVLEEYIIRKSFKNKYLEDIKTSWKDETDWIYVDDMIKHYEELYGDKIELSHES